MANSDTLGPSLSPSVGELTSSYRDGTARPSDTVDRMLSTIADRGEDGTWISVVDRADLMLRAKELEAHSGPTALPLYGIPFGVKDSIDVAGVPTTLACPAYAYTPDATAPAVAALIAAGGIFVGKTNLDQFATGLNGTRTPYPLPRSVFGHGLISGGSSSGSALAVATGEVPFTVATDTAGSGRVPPALNGITGFKPSRGLISTVGLVPACRSLDCISLIAGRVSDLAGVFDLMVGRDERDPYSRDRIRDSRDPRQFRIGLPDIAELEFFGDTAMRDAHLTGRATVERLFPSTVEVPFGPFDDAGALLYSGPWVAERLAEFGDFLAGHRDSVLPVIRTILDGGQKYSAVDVFKAEHRLFELRTEVAQLWKQMDVMVLPTLGTTFTVDQVLADPIATNTILGHYTHFGNLLDLCAIAVPAGLTADGRPASLMILGPALADDRVLAVAAMLTEGSDFTSPTGLLDSPARTTLVVAGHHLEGQPRSADLTALGGSLITRTRTATTYRLLRAGTDTDPVPVLLRAEAGGSDIEVETWSIPSGALSTILSRSSPSVAIGRVALADGSSEIGFVADASVVAEPSVPLEDITAFGGWRSYLAARSTSG